MLFLLLLLMLVLMRHSSLSIFFVLLRLLSKQPHKTKRQNVIKILKYYLFYFIFEFLESLNKENSSRLRLAIEFKKCVHM